MKYSYWELIFREISIHASEEEEGFCKFLSLRFISYYENKEA